MSSKKWWDNLTDECPITLEPLSTLPYPPFILTDDISSDGKNEHHAYFDGLALATYIISQGNFANPLTRVPLTYDDCVRLDEHLNQYVYQQGSDQQQTHLASLGLRGGKVSVKEAYLLRDSIKVKIGNNSRDNQSESDLRRAETLRNEAASALRGLFVFGHSNQSRGRDNVNVRQATQQSLSAPGGYNLYHNPNNSLDNWGMNSSNQQQDGLRIIDDDEAAFEAADVVAWREVQQEFPYITGNNLPPQQPTVNSSNDDEPSDLLQTARNVANLTLQEEKEKANQLERARQLYFLQAFERKKNRIEVRRKAKEEVTVQLCAEKEYDDAVSSAKEEIDQWRAQQWNKWERACERMNIAKPTKPPHATSTEANKNIQQIEVATNHELTAEEKEARAAAKKKAKKQKAKDRAKEKKRLQKLEDEKKERSLALQKEKEASKKKCGTCGQGILGCGFEKVCQLIYEWKNCTAYTQPHVFFV